MSKLWIDTRLSDEEMNFLWECISEKDKESFSKELAGNISKSELIKDKDNWFYETALKKLTEKMFYRNCDNYYEDYIEKKESPPEFELYNLWVNYMKQHEFNPLHTHNGFYSFVIFMKIPTHWKEQHALSFSANSVLPLASDFVFMWSEKGTDTISKHNFPLNPKDEGRMLFFPASLQHEVFPFYGTEEERITISGNICLYDPNRSKMSGDVYKKKKKNMENLKFIVKQIEEELKQMKKADEKEGSN